MTMKTLIVGLGNPMLGDDGVAWRVVEEVRRNLPAGAPVDVKFLSVGGMALMENLIGYERAILVDALKTRDTPAGSISVFCLNDLPHYSAYHVASRGDLPLLQAMELGRAMGAHLPLDVRVVGVMVEHVFEFGESLSPPIQRVVPCVARIVCSLLEECRVLVSAVP